MATPSASDRKDENFQEHIQDLKQMLSDANPAYKKEQYFRVVHTWEDFRQESQNFQPQLWYFYGKGQGDYYSPRLQLENDEKSEKEISVGELVRVFSQTSSPLIVYLNCDFEDQDGLWGSTFQLRNLVPTVVANCPGVKKDPITITA